MIERAGENAFDYTLHGGNGSIRMQWHFFDDSLLAVAVQTWELPPGAGEGRHTHDPDEQPLDELYLVLAGTGRMHVDDEIHDLSAGDSVLATAGTSHDLANTGPDLLRVLVVWGSPGTTDWSQFGTARAARQAREAGQRTSPMSSAQTDG
ncbi:cupin domain-containing protein [Leekyejoonella antrihumi]|uniref:Cupin domain-containing protein n=1 Tax=Leekyejoonella antrihumi TaxID=1660198 RepID=A0A563E9D6_9MICO|nr:cupin domain-containing protein [Leekyejoonella antrihumi]TWP38852.1 cupin domain-containing protein [Leekyejoonella antrihumi]